MLNTIKRNILVKATKGNFFTIIGSFIFAILVRWLYHYLFDYLPIKGELEMLDLTYFGIVVSFRWVFSAYLEYLLEDKYHVPLFAGTVNESVEKQVVILNMVDKDPKQSSAGSSSQPAITRSPSMQEMDKIIAERHKREGTTFPAIDEHYDVGAKMWDVLMEQEKKLLRLHNIKIHKKVEFYEEDGGLELTVPVAMEDNEAKALSKEIGAIDRSLQNKFSEYNNLRKKAAKYEEPDWAYIYMESFNSNQKLYKDLFEKDQKK